VTAVPPRSYLYVPGNAGDKLAKASGRGADALMLDLEDAVPLAEKQAARDQAVEFVGGAQPGGIELWVRVNPGDLGHDDIRALAGLPALSGLALAKADSAAVVAEAAGLLDSLGDDRLMLMPMVESAAALLDVNGIGRAPRVRQIQIGEVDLASELGLAPADDEVELVAIRTSVVVASGAAGIDPPVGPVSRITRDPAALEASTRRLARLGFVGRMCIHVAQIEVVHAVFTPSGEDVAQAHEVVRLLHEAEARGTGVVLDDAGRLIDAAVLGAARRTLEMAARTGIA
jgi:citrate lyase subunit beta / citryl-CoA lyase